MPAINVARTDTFEQQRVKINQISNQVFSISAGGSDLSTGNLKLGDGSLDSPSLAFVNDPNLGLYKSSQETLGFVSASKKIFEYDSTGSYFFRDLLIQKKVLDSVSIQNEGSNYDPGSYSNIPTLKGAGAGGTLDIVVSAYTGTTIGGSGYTAPSGGGAGPGGGSQFQNIPLSGGNGSGNIVSLEVSGGSIVNTTVTTHGDGYELGDVLTLPTNKNNISVAITEDSNSITVADSTGFYVGMVMTKVSGLANLLTATDLNGDPTPLVVTNVMMDGVTIQTNGSGDIDGNAVYNFRAPWGTGTGYSYTIDKVGILSNVSVNTPGNGYEEGDILFVNNLLLTQPISYTVGTSQANTVTFTGNVPTSTFVVGNTYTFTNTGPTGTTNTSATVIERVVSGSFITEITVTISGTGSISAGDTSQGQTVDEVGQLNKYTIDFDDGNGAQLYPNFELLKDNRYVFSVPGEHPFRFSLHPRGIFNTVSGGAIDLSTGSKILTLPSTTGILVGMTVTRDGSVLGEIGSYATGTIVTNVTPNSVTISEYPSSGGTATTIFSGSEYNGTEVIYGSNTVTITPSVDTPATLYYYCTQHANMSGGFGYEAIVTVNQVNPKIFGFDAEILVDSVNISDMVSASVTTGTLTVSDIYGENITGDSIVVNLTSSPLVEASTSVTTPLIKNTADLTLQSGSNILVSATAFNIGTELSITSSSGKLQTTGEIKTTSKLNINDLLTIVDSTLQSYGNNDILLQPAVNRIAKVSTSSAFVIPSGDTFARPTTLAQDGAIRFNTDTNQYEGYSESSSTWSSLGGVRDLDGNTYILAEESVGSNDNTLWFINDNINTVKFTPTHLEFANQKSIRSRNVSAPAYSNWVSNSPVEVGQYLKWKNNLYEVTIAGVTGTSGSEPIHTTGALINGTCELTWFTLAVAPLTFEDIEVLRIGPTSVLPVSINGDLRLANNVVSTDISDLLLRPNSGKKVVIDAESTLAIPAGPDTNRGVAIRGSIRFSTTTGQFEGYDGTNWGSLGGVKDVDQNTYIIPELSPGSNENVLFFYNDNSNTLQVTTTSLDFYSMDSIRSMVSDEFEITAGLLTIDNGSTTLDNTSVSSTFLHTTKQYLDLGLSAGLTTDPVIRLDDQGDVYLNTGFGTGVYNGVKIFDGDLKEFELADLKLLSDKLVLVKGTNNIGSSDLYSSTTSNGSKTTVIAHNPTTGHKEFIEFGVIDDGTDIYYTEYGNIRTGVQLVVASFELAGNNFVRLNIELGDAVNTSEAVNITIVSNVTKK